MRPAVIVLGVTGTIEIATVRHLKTALQRFPVDRTNEVSTIPCSLRITRVSGAVRASSSSAHRYRQWLYRVRVSASSSPGWQINSYRPSGIFRSICSSAARVKRPLTSNPYIPSGICCRGGPCKRRADKQVRFKPTCCSHRSIRTPGDFRHGPAGLRIQTLSIPRVRRLTIWKTGGNMCRCWWLLRWENRSPVC